MKNKVTERTFRTCLLLVMVLMTGIVAGCTHLSPRLCASMQPDGWSAQPIAVTCRFSPDADLDPATRTPVGDEGYYLDVLSESSHWDFRKEKSLLLSIWRNPWGHSWLILESPTNRLEFGHTGDFGLAKPRFHQGVMQAVKNGDPNPIAYLWQMMSDGKLQIGKPHRLPTFVWRMPITQRRYQLINEYVKQRQYDQFGVVSNDCTDMVAESAALAGINLIHRIRLTVPPEMKVWGLMTRMWTDPQYRILEFSTPEVLEVDLRQLAEMGIGSDATEWYRAWKH